MPKVIYIFLFFLLLISHIAKAVYSNLLYGRPSVALPFLWPNNDNCGNRNTAWATDRFMTSCAC